MIPVTHTARRSMLAMLPTLVAALAMPGTATAADQPMTVTQRWKLGGAGGWDYLALDAGGGRLFVSHGTRVDVVDTTAGKVIGTIPETAGVHGIAFAPDLKRGYTSNGKADSVTVFDLDSLKVLQEVKIPAQNPDAILYEPMTKHLFTFNGRSKDFTVLDAATMTVVKTVPVPDKPEFAVDDGAGRIFVNIESEAGQMIVIDTKSLAIQATWPLPGCSSPSGLALDRIHHRLFSVCDGKVMAVTDALTGKQVARVAIGEGADAAAYDAKRGLVLSSNGDGTLSVVLQKSADQYAPARSVATQRGARTMAYDEVTGKVYLVTADFGPAPAPTPAQPHPRPVPTADSFTVLVVGSPGS